jgi:hypothetical protein
MNDASHGRPSNRPRKEAANRPLDGFINILLLVARSNFEVLSNSFVRKYNIHTKPFAHSEIKYTFV